jgi:hypothetical protein
VTAHWQGGSLWITDLPVDAMGRIAGCAPQGREETQVLAALLAGARVLALREALEYRKYRKTAPAGVYRRCVALERKLREMGVIVVRNRAGQPVGHQKGGEFGGADLPDRPPERQ